MSALFLALGLSLLAGAPRGEPNIRLIEPGSDPADGLLVNYTRGATPFTPPDAGRPTLVVAHGLNPFHPVAHFSIAPRYGEISGARYGDAVNCVGWDWNACTGTGLRAHERQAGPVEHGQRLAQALLVSGLEPERIHLLGQSTGCIVAASAAREIAMQTGRPVARLTLLDPLIGDHQLIFEELAVGWMASRVDHFWVPGLSGFGKPAPYPNVINYQVDGPRGALGLVNPTRTDHLHAVRWHLTHVAPW